jgi:hypothetical protein
LMSTSLFGATIRRFIIGTRLWQPARIFVSSPSWASAARTPSTSVGRRYSKGGGLMTPSLELTALHAAGRFAEAIRRP